MSIPKLYTTLPLNNDGELDLETFTDHSSEIIDGEDGEKFVVLSYFPKTLRYSKLNNFVLNKYVLFVLDENESANYTIQWRRDITHLDVSVIDRFLQEEIPASSEFEYSFGLKDLTYPETSDWQLTLTIHCDIFKNGELVKVIEMEQTILPIEDSLLSQNEASFEDESESDNSAVSLGNERTTHFMRGHLSEYLTGKKKSESGDDSESPDNTGAFVHQTASITYLKVMSGILSLIPGGSDQEGDGTYNNTFNQIFSNQDIEQTIIQERDFNPHAYRYIGICDLHLHHVLPIILGSEADRVHENPEILEDLRMKFTMDYDKFIIAYHRSVFPKSAIGLSVEIFDHLFTSFKENASESNPIYHTYEQNGADQTRKISEWKSLTYSELREVSSDKFMKNLVTEYYWGHFITINIDKISFVGPQSILKIDWSQFIQKILTPPPSRFSLNDFLTSNESLDQAVEDVFNGLDPHDRVAQMLMPAAEMAYKRDVDDEDNDGKVDDWVADFTRDGRAIGKIKTLIRERKIGGVLLLKGTKDQFSRWSEDFRELNAEIGPLPLLISADAEPTLINDKMRELPAIMKANEMTTLREVEDTATQICDIISERGINYNFAPVVDVAQNYVRERSFGTVPANLLPFSKKFIDTVQSRNIIATAKHFPGHGLVVGDTHKPVSGGDDKKIVVIDGEFGELENYPPLIEHGVLSIMIAHIVVRNNEYHTDTLPASLSKRIVTDLLRNELGFKGLIVTDGLNMGAVTYVPDLAIKAVEAGVDILELLIDTSQAHADILAKYNADSDFKGLVDTACKRIVRMKICLGLI